MRLLLIKILFLGCLVIPLTGCETIKELGKDLGLGSDDSSTKDEYVGWNEAKFHEQATEAMRGSNYDKAVKLYEAMEARFPFGDYAAQTQLDIAYAYHKNGDPEASIAAADRFIKINPRNPSIDYAFYLKGLVNYNRGISFIDRYLPTDSSQRDQVHARDSLAIFQELVRRFPKSKYAEDANQRIISLRNNLAMHEIHIANYYMKRKAYLAAIGRANEVIQNYQKTPAVPYALQIMQEAYTTLGMTSLAEDTKRVYTLNFPNGTAAIEAQQANTVNKVWDFIGLDK